MVSCIFLLFGSYFKLFYLPWTAQEELCCALSSADSGKCQLCCSSVSNMFLERFKNSTVWNISISSLVDENWGGVNSFLLHWSKKSCSVQVLWGWSQLLVLERQHCEGTWSEPELQKIPAVVRAASRPGTCGSCGSAGHSRTGHPAADLPLLLLQLAWGAPLCVLLQHTQETKCKLGTPPRHPPQSYSAIPFLLSWSTSPLATWLMPCVHWHLLNWKQQFSFQLTSPLFSWIFQHFFLYFLVLPTPACFFFFLHCWYFLQWYLLLHSPSEGSLEDSHLQCCPRELLGSSLLWQPCIYMC